MLERAWGNELQLKLKGCGRVKKVKRRDGILGKGTVFPGKGRGCVVTVQDLGDKCTLCVAVLVTTPVQLEKRFKEELGWRSTWEDGGRGGTCVQIPEMKLVRGLSWGMTSGKRLQV